MAIKQQITCDVCGKLKGHVNHWFIFDPPSQGQQIFLLARWSDERAISYKHACGQECVIKAVSEWMQEKVGE